MSTEKLRLYWWQDDKDSYGEDGYCIAVVARSRKEAMRLGASWALSEFGLNHDWFITQRCTWMRNSKADLTGLYGVIDDTRLGCERGIYSGALDDCDKCGAMDNCQWISETKQLLCTDCEDKIEGSVSGDE